MRRTRFEASLEKMRATDSADAEGKICDSNAIRLELMKRVRAGEITLIQAQNELKTIKQQGKREGKLTRAQVYNRS